MMTKTGFNNHSEDTCKMRDEEVHPHCEHYCLKRVRDGGDGCEYGERGVYCHRSMSDEQTTVTNIRKSNLQMRGYLDLNDWSSKPNHKYIGRPSK